MGWNSGYTVFEATVVGAYDIGKLDKPLLRVLMEPYRGTDIDSGGSMDLRAKDGLDVVDIVLKVWGVDAPIKPDIPKDWKQCTEEQRAASDAYFDARFDAFYELTHNEFGWR